VWTTAGTFDAGRGSVAGWLISITRSRSFDRLRNRVTRAKYEQASSLFTNPAADPEHEAGEAQARTHLLHALETLPTEQRRVIELAYFAGLSATEIALRLGTPLGTVKTRVRMGLMKLRRIFAARGSFDPAPQAYRGHGGVTN
jgi:RNA polymerase sigma-70 factor (ECF subfamily)